MERNRGEGKQQRRTEQPVAARLSRDSSWIRENPRAPTRLPTRSTPSRPVTKPRAALLPRWQRETLPVPPPYVCTADGVPRGAARERGLPRQPRAAATRAPRRAPGPGPAPRVVGRRRRQLRPRRRPPRDQGQSRLRIAVRSAWFRLPIQQSDILPGG